MGVFPFAMEAPARSPRRRTPSGPRSSRSCSSSTRPTPSTKGATIEQALELTEIRDRLSDFWGVTKGQVKVALAVGLLLRNGLVMVQSPGGVLLAAAARPPASGTRSRPRARSSSSGAIADLRADRLNRRSRAARPVRLPANR